MNQKFKYWIRRYITVPLGSLLIRLGINRKNWLWRTIHAISPRLAGLCILMDDSQRPENNLLWYWDDTAPDIGEISAKEILSDINKMITRAPVPFGGDDFLIMIRQFGPVLDQEGCFSLDSYEELKKFLQVHPLIRAWTLRGTRWIDWNKGEAKERLYDVLLKAAPTRIAPLTLIGVVIVGRAVARAVLSTQGNPPSF
jgi:hypothetical protein